jgi:hypothetical protein
MEVDVTEAELKTESTLLGISALHLGQRTVLSSSWIL